MSRIAESLRRLIREEVQKSLRRKLREDAKSDSSLFDLLYPQGFNATSDLVLLKDEEAGDYKYYHDEATDRNFLYKISNDNILYVREDGKKYEAITAKDQNIFDAVKAAMQDADEQADTAAAPAAAAPAKSGSSSKSNSTVVKIQDALRTYDKGTVVNGKWDSKTQDAWERFVEATALANLFAPSGDAFVGVLSKNWAENSNKITSIGGDSSFNSYPPNASGMLSFISKVIEASSKSSDTPGSTPPKAEKSYADMSIEELTSLQAKLAAEEKAAAEKATARSDDYDANRHSNISDELDKLRRVINDKIRSANTTDAKALTALENNFKDNEEFNFALAESRWLRLAGLLKG